MEEVNKNTELNDTDKKLHISDVRSSLWVNADDRTPTENLWFICYVNGIRIPLKFNTEYQHWYANSGRTYRVYEIERWLDA